ncbi:ammonia-forming cytochrome c nitrite reductase subunit c552 [Opitutus terrae]|uniref:nitrite reductase (cytochrome; ammonia-forming) n=1 Tax=Opitutus terrae (strain DSM 11246 / JCM 15787 / PB90-1) TaxID=452637 RepID=B2A0C5_OPITP|nr:ammonia-forming cytochrome c nitrite reductase subunit c552 [Opitutus terrae]ACB77879.1 Nitrite reductase (cytochrome; ammonia-forming) [Opitutus terrae PB90-1]
MMTFTRSPRLSDCRGLALWVYIAVLAAIAVASFLVLLLYQNIVARQAEATQHVFRVVEVNDSVTDPVLWGKNYPRQYDSYRRTVDKVETKYGGSEAFQHLDRDPAWRTIFNGYAFAIDYREERGHAYMLSDQRETERVHKFKQPGSCLQCHASVIPAYIEAGLKAGAPAGKEHREEQIQKGFEVVCAMPYTEATKLAEHPVSCIDCHDAETMNLRVSRPAFLNGIRALAKSDYPTPHLPSIERWRREGRQGEYQPNAEATRQEMRSLVCAQCHNEYYFKGEQKLVTNPWNKGLRVEHIEAYYDGQNYSDWKHKDTGAGVLKAQHPEFEMWSQGIHARSGVACADCHMPYQREGAIKVSNHHVRSPLLNTAAACQTCHRVPEPELRARVEIIQDRNRALLNRGQEAIVGLITALSDARTAGASDAQLQAARELQRKAQWRLDFVYAENSMGFHASQEAARILAEAIDYARQGQIEVAKNGAKPATVASVGGAD